MAKFPDPYNKNAKTADPGTGFASSFFVQQWNLLLAFVKSTLADASAVLADLAAIQAQIAEITAEIAALDDNTGVTAGTYGDATNVGQFTVNAKGKLTAAVNVPITGGGGSGPSPFWATNPTAPTISPFTLVKGGGTTATLANTTRGFTLEVIRASPTGDRGALAQQAIPASTFVMTALFVPNAQSTQFDSFGLFVKDNGTGLIQQFCYSNAQLGRQNWSALDTFVASSFQGSNYRGASPVWLRLQLTSTDLIFSVSMDGETWAQVSSSAKGSYVASITHCGVELMTNPSSGYAGQAANVHVMSYACV